MDRSEARQLVEAAFAPPTDDDVWIVLPPTSRLRKAYDLKFWTPFEFGTGSPLLRQVGNANDELQGVIQSLTVPQLLMESALRLVGDGLVEYADKPRPCQEFFRHLPPALITFTSGFEALVRLQCETFVTVAKELPQAVRLALLGVEEHVDPRGQISTRRARSGSILERYWLLLKYGYHLDFDRGCREWQLADQAIRTRNAIVHYEIQECPSLNANNVLNLMDGLLLAFVAPSAKVGRSLWSHQWNELYYLDGLREALQAIGDFEETSVHKGWPKRDNYSFPCPFLNVDDARYPSRDQFRKDGPNE